MQKKTSATTHSFHRSQDATPARRFLIAMIWFIPFLLLMAAIPSDAPAQEATCGDAVLDAGEQCDDGNLLDGDCCSSACMLEADGSACDDADACTQTDTCQAGVCLGLDPVVCTPPSQCHASACDPATGLCIDSVQPDPALLTLSPEADAYTDIDEPLTNFGTGGSLRVDGRPGRRAYLRFDVSGVTGMPVQSAILRLQVTEEESAGSDLGGDAYLVTDSSWDESTLTHANRPPMDGGLLDSAGPVGLGETVEFDVTAAISTDGLYTFGIEPASNNMAIYASREAAAGQPELIITIYAPCDDGDGCTQVDQCVAATCVGTTPVVCTALDGCHEAGVCDPASGECSNPTLPDGTTCDDGNACTLTDSCLAGICDGTDPIICTVSDQCHVIGVCDPASGLCSDPAVTDGTVCDDASACTLDDACIAGTCTGTPVTCSASDQCHATGSCDPATGLCSDPLKADGAACDDGNGCTLTDTCIAGACIGANPRICTALDQCHVAGACDPATGACSNPDKADGTDCNDDNACTQSDACIAGICTGANPIICPASDQCHEPSICNPATGACSNDAKSNGVACDDGNACTRTDTCTAGTCVGRNPVTCTALDQCHDAGTCNPTTGRCSSPVRADGAACDDGDVCTDGDACVAGECIGQIVPDTDGDRVCDAIDLCRNVPDPGQIDEDHDGVGDACQCTAPAPGRCISGGGSKKTDCFVELNTVGPVELNRKGTKLKSTIACTDGDPACDLDESRDGQCTFGIALCFGNSDPRHSRCTPSMVQSVELKRPNPARSTVGQQLEDAMGTLGIQVRRRKQIVSEGTGLMGNNTCSALIRLAAPGPRGTKPAKHKFQIQSTDINGKRDKDKFVLVCK